MNLSIQKNQRKITIFKNLYKNKIILFDGISFDYK